jgi:hypothetical protein
MVNDSIGSVGIPRPTGLKLDLAPRENRWPSSVGRRNSAAGRANRSSGRVFEVPDPRRAAGLGRLRTHRADTLVSSQRFLQPRRYARVQKTVFFR